MRTTDRRIRVTMLIQDYYPIIGGAERQLRNLSTHLCDQGVDVHILTRRQPGTAARDFVDDVPVYRLPVFKPRQLTSPVFTLLGLQLIRQIHPDVIHAHGFFSPLTTALAAKRIFGTPVVVKSLRGGELGDVARLGRKLLGKRRVAAAVTSGSTFIAISREIEQELASLGVPKARRRFIPNGIDTDRFVPIAIERKLELRALLGLPHGPLVIFVGRLVPEKRVGQLVEIWPRVREVNPEATLLVLGSGPLESSLRAVHEPGVQFAGAVDDVLPYLQAADAFVLPSSAEGLSNSLLEAMSVGLPPVATAVGGALDLIIPGETGWLVPVDDPGALHQVLTTLITDEPLRRQLGKAARDRVIDDYALTSIARQLRELYEDLITTRSYQAR